MLCIVLKTCYAQKLENFIYKLRENRNEFNHKIIKTNVNKNIAKKISYKRYKSAL